jgi:hypothetical protein
MGYIFPGGFIKSLVRPSPNCDEKLKKFFNLLLKTCITKQDWKGAIHTRVLYAFFAHWCPECSYLFQIAFITK